MAAARRLEPPFRAPTGLAVGLARKGPRYAGRRRRFAPGHRNGLWVPRLSPVGPEGVRLVTTTGARYTSCRLLCLAVAPIVRPCQGFRHGARTDLAAPVALGAVLQGFFAARRRGRRRRARVRPRLAGGHRTRG